MKPKYIEQTKFIADQVYQALSKVIDLINENFIERNEIKVVVEKNKNSKFGEYSTKFALNLGINKNKAMALATEVVNKIDKKYFDIVNAIKPGFINFSLKPIYATPVLNEIIKTKSKFGSTKKTKLNYNVEFVSANPTGLLHIGHARNAAIGDTLARIFETSGINVTREYYINDAGNQIEMLGISVLVRYLQLFNIDVQLPKDSYHANEIIEVAKALKEKYHETFLDVKFNDAGFLNQYKPQGEVIKDFAKSYLLNLIKKSLASLDVSMDIWFSEKKLYENNLIEKTKDVLRKNTYEKDGAVWLKTTAMSDDKDRVIVKSDGANTYFMPDIAYHNIKLSRGYDKLYNIWGADHASYAERMKIAIQLLGYDKSKQEILLIQMVRLIKDGKEFKMSKRTGQSLTLDDLIQLIGKDAARWFLVAQPMTTHLEIDIDKVSAKNNENQLYYVQYASARINQILNKIKADKPISFNLLNQSIEKEIIAMLSIYPSTLRNIVTHNEVNILNIYLTNLAKLFHSYYGKNKIIDEKNLALTQQRYWLVYCIRQVISNGLALMSIDASEQM